jgi:hypothetical protein
MASYEDVARLGILCMSSYEDAFEDSGVGSPLNRVSAPKPFSTTAKLAGPHGLSVSPNRTSTSAYAQHATKDSANRSSRAANRKGLTSFVEGLSIRGYLGVAQLHSHQTDAEGNVLTRQAYHMLVEHTRKSYLPRRGSSEAGLKHDDHCRLASGWRDRWCRTESVGRMP